MPATTTDFLGIRLRVWALSAALFNILYWTGMTVLALLARKGVLELVETATAEGGEESVWANAEMVSLSCSILFALVALSSLALAYFVLSTFSSPSSAATSKPFKYTWIFSTGYAIFMAAWCVAGDIMSFGSVLEEVEEVCAVVDTECYPSYQRLGKLSIPAQAIGLHCLVWLLYSTYRYRLNPAPSSTDDLEAALPLTSKLAAASSSPSSPFVDAHTQSSHSLGRHFHREHSRQRAKREKEEKRDRCSRRLSSTTEHSLSKRSTSQHQRYDSLSSSNRDDVGDERRRTASLSRGRLQRYEAKAEEVVRSWSRRRSRSRSVGGGDVGEGGRRSTSRLGRKGYSSDDGEEEELRSMGEMREKSRSRLHGRRHQSRNRSRSGRY